LIEQIDAGIGRKLTLVSAPAGYGKTTLVSAWARHSGRPVAWYSIDKNDNDLARFLTYLVAAFQKLNEDTGADIQAALEDSAGRNDIDEAGKRGRGSSK
jgi:LuxR family maltose regulon positive regulatory protein